MATDYSDLITLDEVKHQLRLRAGDDSRDDYLNGIRDGALASVESYTGLTLRDKEVTESFMPPDAFQSYRIKGDGVHIDNTDPNRKSINVPVEYVDEDLNVVSTFECLAVADRYLGGRSALLYPPSSGWPYTADRKPGGGTFRVTISLVGPTASEFDPALKSAALMRCTSLFHGHDMEPLPMHNPVKQILAPFVRYPR